MASEVQSFDCLIPAGTAAASPAVFSLATGPRVLTSAQIKFPPGPRGQVGVALAVSGVQVVPVTAGSWFVTDNETLTLDLTRYPTTGAWTLLGYNTGTYPHTITARLFLDLLPSWTNPDAGQPSLISPAVLSTLTPAQGV